MVTHQEKEKELVKFWKENRIFEKSVNQRNGKKEYVFYDGPPFATGTPHHGHILGLTIKDVYPRFWTMKGHQVKRKWGWDCHGLPIEHIAEKELGIKEKKEIENYGIDKFNEFCRSKVLKFADEWGKTVDRIGKWIEFDNSYKTMDNSYMESVWYIFKRLYDKGNIYEGKKILMYCSRCETPLSNNEIAMDNSYKDVTEKTAYVKFKLKNDKNTFFLAWTTTPWTLIGNVALSINPKVKYVKVKTGKEYFIIAKSRLEILKEKYEITEEFEGKRLLNKEYEPLYNIQTDKKGFYIVDGGNDVSDEDGTGIVHMAIYGEFDYEMIKKYDLPVIQHLDNSGKLELGPKEWRGFYFKKVNKFALEDLENRNLLFKTQDYTHSYPFCYRCDTPLYYNAVDSWFVNIQKVKSKLLEQNKNINWYPNHFKEGRFNYNLETAPDWSISRNRFWATAIPVWKCNNKKCNHIEVVGSVEELKKVAIEEVSNDLDLHKHIVDNIHLKCKKCQSQMTRIPEVLDCWFESGSMPYAAKHYPFANKKEFENTFPADFVSEYVAQVRAWYYYMHIIGVLLFDKAPFKNVVVSGNILASDGSKMSKSKKNFTPPETILEQYGADALRFYLMSTPLTKAEDSNFYDDGVKEAYRKIVVLLSNVKRFYELFDKVDKLTTSKSKNILDIWILSKLNLLNQNVTNSLNNYNTTQACSEITHFVNDLSTWYIRRSRDRFKSNDSNVKQDAMQTLETVLITLSKLIAPIVPFISEDIYQSFKGQNKQLLESVHLEDWPKLNESKIKIQIHENMEQTRELVKKILDERENVKIPIRQVLSKVTISGIKLPDEYLDLIKEEVNVKNVVLKNDTKVNVQLDTKLTNDLLEEGIFRDLVRKFNSERKKAKLTISDNIKISLKTDDSMILNSIKRFESELKSSLQAKEVELNVNENLEQEFKIKEKVIKFDLKVI